MITKPITEEYNKISTQEDTLLLEKRAGWGVAFKAHTSLPN